MSTRRTCPQTLLIIILILITLSCAMPSFDAQPAGLQDTQIALGVQQTSLALQQATVNAGQSQSEAAAAESIHTPLPTFTLLPAVTETTAPPSPTVTDTQSNISAPPISIEDQIRTANVLIFEDIWGDPVLAGDKRVSDAIERIGFEGGKVINTGDAMGNFKSQLLSGTNWDLIIVSAEVRTSIQGEFWDYIMDQLNNKVAFIAEVWYLDDTAYGRVANFLGACGVQFQEDWGRGINYNVLDYSILNLITDHPIFNTPSSGVTLVTPNVYWMGDAGDLIRLGTGGDAQILAGVYFNRKTDYGLIAECMQGRVILQTFSTHDYRYDQTVPLWQNYITYTLTNHFATMNSQ
jgi:hypothetical protein